MSKKDQELHLYAKLQQRYWRWFKSDLKLRISEWVSYNWKLMIQWAYLNNCSFLDLKSTKIISSFTISEKNTIKKLTMMNCYLSLTDIINYFFKTDVENFHMTEVNYTLHRYIKPEPSTSVIFITIQMDLLCTGIVIKSSMKYGCIYFKWKHKTIFQ